MKASSAPSNASTASRSASSSSSTRKSGSIPALSACARSRREQKPWIVEIHAPSAARACSRSPSSLKRRLRRGVRISAAAFSVKVIARIDSTATPSSATARTKRSTSTAVLPVPAPARTRSEPSRRSTARCCSAVSSVTPRSGRSRGRSSRRSMRSCRASCRARPRRMRSSVSRMRSSAQASLERKASGSRRSLATKPEPSPSTSAATMPRGRGSSLPRATYTPARRPQAQQPLDHEHVERRLEAVLRLPARHLVAVDALRALVVEHQRLAVARVHAVDAPPHPQAGGDLDRPRFLAVAERELEVLGLEGRVGLGLGAQETQQVELEPARGGPHACLLGRQPERRAAVAQLLEQNALGIGRGWRGSRGAGRSPPAGGGRCARAPRGRSRRAPSPPDPGPARPGAKRPARATSPGSRRSARERRRTPPRGRRARRAAARRRAARAGAPRAAGPWPRAPGPTRRRWGRRPGSR